MENTKPEFLEGDSSDCHDDMMSHNMSMPMTFHWGYHETVLFSFWRIDSIPKLALSMVAIFLLSMLSEALKIIKQNMELELRYVRAQDILKQMNDLC